MSQLLKKLFYIASFFVFFILFFIWTLPYDALQNSLLHQVEDSLNAASGKSFRLKAQKMDVSLFTGLTLKEMEWIDRGQGDVVLLQASKFRVNPSITSLIFGSFKASYLLVVGKGELSGHIKDTKESTEIDLEADALPLDVLKGLLGVSFSGSIDGEMELSLDKKSAAKNIGHLKFDFKNASLLNLKIPLDARNPSAVLAFDELKFAKDKGSVLEWNLKGTALDLKEFKLNGDDFQLFNVKGNFNLGKSLAQTTIDLSGNIILNTQIAQKIPLYPLIEPQKHEDGSFDFKLNGTLASVPRYPTLNVGKFTDILNQLMSAPSS